MNLDVCDVKKHWIFSKKLSECGMRARVEEKSLLEKESSFAEVALSGFRIFPRNELILKKH